MVRRYHRDLGIPAGIPDPVIGAALTYSVHAHTEACKDHVQHCLPVSVPVSFDLIEVEVEAENNAPLKWVIRFAISADFDLVLAVSNGYLVKTVWVNRSCDTHLMNFDRSKYDRPEPVEA
jgi:hypothetical protein